LSPLKSDDLDLESDEDAEEDMSVNDFSAEEDVLETGLKTGLEKRGTEMAPSYAHAHRKDFEALQARQYWRKDRKGEAIAVGRDKFDMGDASTLGGWRLHSHLKQSQSRPISFKDLHCTPFCALLELERLILSS